MISENTQRQWCWNLSDIQEIVKLFLVPTIMQNIALTSWFQKTLKNNDNDDEIWVKYMKLWSYFSATYLAKHSFNLMMMMESDSQIPAIVKWIQLCVFCKRLKMMVMSMTNADDNTTWPTHMTNHRSHFICLQNIF